MLKQLVGLAIGLILATSASAETKGEWVTIRDAADGKFQIDLSSGKRQGDIAEGSYRFLLKEPRELRSTMSAADVLPGEGGTTRSKPRPIVRKYVMTINLVQVDCEKDRIRTYATGFADASDSIIDELPPGDWAKINEGAVEGEIANAICLLTGSQTVKNVRAGKWKPLSKGDGAEAFYESDRIVSLAEGREGNAVMVTARGEFKDYQVEDGIPYRIILQHFALDCSERKVANLAIEYYLNPTTFLYGEEADEDDIEFERVTKDSLFGEQYEAICKAPRIAMEEKKSKSPRKEASTEGLVFGTAWATNKGYMVTASHVVTGAGKIELYQDGKKIGVAQLVANDQANDVALLKFVPKDGAKLTMIPLADRPGALGRSVFTLGFPAPDVMGQKIKMSKGDISGTAGIQDDARFLQISIPIQQGNSGGPVVGFDGSAVGVVSSKLTRFTDERDALKPENVNYAVKVSYVKPLLEELPDLADYVPIKATGASQEELIAQVSQAVYMVVVSP